MALPFALCWSASKQQLVPSKEDFEDGTTQPHVPEVWSQTESDVLVSNLQDNTYDHR